MMFISGTSAPLDLLPAWMLALGKALPLYPRRDLMVDPGTAMAAASCSSRSSAASVWPPPSWAAALFQWE